MAEVNHQTAPGSAAGRVEKSRSSSPAVGAARRAARAGVPRRAWPAPASPPARGPDGFRTRTPAFPGACPESWATRVPRPAQLSGGYGLSGPLPFQATGSPRTLFLLQPHKVGGRRGPQPLLRDQESCHGLPVLPLVVNQRAGGANGTWLPTFPVPGLRATVQRANRQRTACLAATPPRRSPRRRPGRSSDA